jgi:hypothetical protein
VVHLLQEEKEIMMIASMAMIENDFFIVCFFIVKNDSANVYEHCR